ncbi:unnamed protein product, partial [Mesorhabditis belari]|uniref:Uncharacterized protein n=1 Tax=Mesorhabditis belari TaxID=2138241 RepID=A0AAF3EM87_9BILA
MKSFTVSLSFLLIVAGVFAEEVALHDKPPASLVRSGIEQRQAIPNDQTTISPIGGGVMDNHKSFGSASGEDETSGLGVMDGHKGPNVQSGQGLIGSEENIGGHLDEPDVKIGATTTAKPDDSAEVTTLAAGQTRTHKAKTNLGHGHGHGHGRFDDYEDYGMMRYPGMHEFGYPGYPPMMMPPYGFMDHYRHGFGGMGRGFGEDNYKNRHQGYDVMGNDKYYDSDEDSDEDEDRDRRE